MNKIILIAFFILLTLLQINYIKFPVTQTTEIDTSKTRDITYITSSYDYPRSLGVYLTLGTFFVSICFIYGMMILWKQLTKRKR